jgi:uncharacterized membrane protein
MVIAIPVLGVFVALRRNEETKPRPFDRRALIFCVLSTLAFARMAARLANKASPATLNRVTGVILVVLGAVILSVNLLT